MILLLRLVLLGYLQKKPEFLTFFFLISSFFALNSHINFDLKDINIFIPDLNEALDNKMIKLFLYILLSKIHVCLSIIIVIDQSILGSFYIKFGANFSSINQFKYIVKPGASSKNNRFLLKVFATFSSIELRTKVDDALIFSSIIVSLV